MTPSPRTDSRRLTEHALPSEAAHAELTGDLRVVVESLHRTYDQRVGASAVQGEVQQVADRFTSATVRAFVPLLVLRYAAARLSALQVEPQAATGTGPGTPSRG